MNLKSIAAGASRSLILFIAAVLAGFLALALSGCGSQESSEAENQNVAGASYEEMYPESSVTSTAMVVLNEDGRVLLVDQDTETPFFPTIPEGALVTANGTAITVDQLEPGNVVQVTGNGIMLESWPAQYPGITEIKVIDAGSPEDAERYADIAEQVRIHPDPNEVPFGTIEYKTDLATVSVMLEPSSYFWRIITDNGEEPVIVENALFDETGIVTEGIPDARLAEPAEAILGFNATVESAVVTRMPLVGTGSPAVDPNAPAEEVDCEVMANGTVEAVLEPGFLYSFQVFFHDGSLTCPLIVTE